MHLMTERKCFKQQNITHAPPFFDNATHNEWQCKKSSAKMQIYSFCLATKNLQSSKGP